MKITLKKSPKVGLDILIETKSLLIKSLKTYKFLNEYIQMFTNSEVIKNYEAGIPLTKEEIRFRIDSWIKRWLNNNPYSCYTVLNKHNLNFLGQIDIEFSDITPKGAAEIGFVYKKDVWGMGVGTEAAFAIIHCLIPYLLKHNYQINNHTLNSIIATTKVNNLFSQKILEKIGFIKKRNILVRFGSERYQYYMDL